jgi:hypothetical protein
MKYVLCIPYAGFNDVLGVIGKCYSYCKQYNRTLLIKHVPSYKIIFDDYFYFNELSEINIITDNNEIDKILLENNKSVYPYYLRNDLVNTNFRGMKYRTGFTWTKSKIERNVGFDFNSGYTENIITYVNCGSYCGINYKITSPKQIFEMLEFRFNLLVDFFEKYKKLNKNYIGLQIRNSDRYCDYKKMYYDNIDEIKKNDNIFIATDDKFCLDFFRKQNINLTCFTYFPKNIKPKRSYILSNLIDNDTKIKDTISDLLLLMVSANILSNSNGGFINLARYFNNNPIIYNKTFEKINKNIAKYEKEKSKQEEEKSKQEKEKSKQEKEKSKQEKEKEKSDNRLLLILKSKQK